MNAHPNKISSDVNFGGDALRENFLLAVQLAIVKQQLDARSVVVYWVRQSDSGSAVIDKIEFDELGRVKGDKWPPGVCSD